MCGRFSLYSISQFLKRYNIELDEPLKPKYNIAPTQETPVIIDGKAKMMKWGLKLKNLCINTKIETFKQNPFFSELKRILVPADGFYEWKAKQPYRIETGEVFSFAGLTYQDRFSIITMPPTKEISRLHDRMPAVLQDEDRWLNQGNIEPQQNFKIYPVSSKVNNVKNEGKELINPVLSNTGRSQCHLSLP